MYLPHCCMQSVSVSSKSQRLNDSLLSQTYLVLGVSTSRPWYQNLLFSGGYVSAQFLCLFMQLASQGSRQTYCNKSHTWRFFNCVPLPRSESLNFWSTLFILKICSEKLIDPLPRVVGDKLKL